MKGFDNEEEMRQATRRTNYLLSETAKTDINSVGMNAFHKNNTPLFDLHLRPASSHRYKNVKFELPNYTVATMHKIERTANPILKSGWTWHEIPVANQEDAEKQLPFVTSKDNYNAFDRPVIPHLIRIQTKELEPLPDIITNTKLQIVIAKTLEIKSKIESKPHCPLPKESKIMRDISKSGQKYPLTPTGTRQTSAFLKDIEQKQSDTLSNWTIFIKDGCVVSTSDAYLNFRNKSRDIWPQINYYIWKVEVLIRRYAIPCAELRCQELINLAKIIPANAAQLSWEILNHVIYNADEVIGIIKTPGRIYKGFGPESNRVLAAKRIQNLCQGRKSRIELKRYSEMIKSAKTMVHSFRLKKFRRNLYNQIQTRFDNVYKKSFYRLMGDFAICSNEKGFNERRKVIVQMAPRFAEIDLMDCVIGKILILLQDPSIERMILVIPLLTQDKDNYICTQLDSGFLDFNPLKTGRLKLISPESSKCFLSGASVASMLNASHKALAKVKELIHGKFAVLMSDFAGRSEISLSAILNIPFCGPKPEKAKKLNTRHKARNFLKRAGIEVVPGMSFKSGTEIKLKDALIYANSLYPNMPIWEVFEKRRSGYLDFAKHDFVCDAWIDSDRIPELSEEETIDETMESLNLARNLRLTKCPSHVQFIERLCGKIGPKFVTGGLKGTGGFIQARPVRDGTLMRRLEIGFFLDASPTAGQATQLVSCEAVLDKEFEQIAMIVPQQKMPHAMLLKIIERISSACLKAGIFGYIGLQMHVWRDIGMERNGWWVNHLYPFLSPSLLKASSVIVATGCPIDMKSGTAKFNWSDIPLHLEKTHEAVYTNQSLLRQDFESAIKKQAGSPGEHRKLTDYRGEVSLALAGKTESNLMKSCVAGDYKSGVVAFLKDIALCNRRLKHYDLPDLVSNIKDIARFFIEEWKNLELYPQICFAVPLYPEFTSDKYATIFSSLKKTEDLASLSGAPGKKYHGSSAIITRNENLANNIKKRVHEDTIVTSDSENSCNEEVQTQLHGERQASIFDAAQLYHQHKQHQQTNNSNIFMPITTEKKELTLLEFCAQKFRLADRAYSAAWWDTTLFQTINAETGNICYLDPYDPENPTNRHFEFLKPSNNNDNNNVIDLDAIISKAIPQLSKLASTSSARPVTSCARKIAQVFQEIERLKRPPPPPKEQRSTLSVNLLNEGIPSQVAAKFDIAFKRPHLSPPFKSTQRYLRIRRGEFGPSELAKVEAALKKFEDLYEDVFGNESDDGDDEYEYELGMEENPVEKKRTKKTFAIRGNEGQQVGGENGRDFAIAAAFELMNQVSAKEPTSLARKNELGNSTEILPRKNSDYDTVNSFLDYCVWDQKKTKKIPVPNNSDKNVQNALEKMSKLSERAGEFETKFETMQMERKKSVMQRQESVLAPQVFPLPANNIVTPIGVIQIESPEENIGSAEDLRTLAAKNLFNKTRTTSFKDEGIILGVAMGVKKRIRQQSLIRQTSIFKEE
ncbi:hypothetical protein HK100_001917 [Physocladia obscura]|uniref:Uncharacterized protein n=1 Tax=Physocladia obscura TaxID=109957 RepID=A0AAD5T893_9FUNG|nr:hypothetical protein HK100_001917 [Physocladia obscura]